MRLRTPSRTAALAGAALGYGLWLSSPFLVGRAEPWDASFPFYAPVMLGGGALAGAWLPRHAIAFLLGVWIGQVLALATLPDHPRSWLGLGAVTTAIGSTLSLPCYVAAARIRVWLSARRSESTSG